MKGPATGQKVNSGSLKKWVDHHLAAASFTEICHGLAWIYHVLAEIDHGFYAFTGWWFQAL